MMNNNNMINYLKNNKINNNLNNNKINNNLIKNESNFFHFNNEFCKDLTKRRNRVNIFEEHSKLINSRKFFNIKKNKEESSKQNTFDKDTKLEKAKSFNCNNININNSRSHIKKKDLLNKIRIFSLNENMSTITYENLLDKNKTLINFKKNRDTKFVRCKKEIFEKISKNIGNMEGFLKKKEIHLDMKDAKRNENKNNIKINLKAKSSLETENIIEKNEKKENEKGKDKNKTEINKDIESYKEDKDENTNINETKNEINMKIKLEKEENCKKEKKILEIKKKPIKINKISEKNNEKSENKVINKITNHNQIKIEEKENNIKKENTKKEEEKNKKIEENISKEIKVNKKENIIPIIEKENNLNINDIVNVDDEESTLSYFDITKIKNDKQIPKEYINIIYNNLLKEEERNLYPKPILEKIKSQKEINEQMRSILVDWIIDVHFKFGFTDETLFMTILIIDRYMSIKQISKIRFQLLGITAMLISCKHEEIILPKVDDFIYITDNAYTKKEVFEMENDILNSFNFDLLYPSPIKFYEFMALKFDFDKKKFLMGKYLMETFLVDLKWINYRPAIISCACAYIVMKFYKMENYQEAYNKKYYNYNENDFDNPKFCGEYDIKECAKDICYYVDNINKTNFMSCKNKYSSDDNEKIALIVEGQKS